MQNLATDLLSRIVADVTVQADNPLFTMSMVTRVNMGLRTAASDSSVWKAVYKHRWRGARKQVDCNNWKALYHAGEIEARHSIETINAQHAGAVGSMLDTVDALGCQTPVAVAHFLWVRKGAIERRALAQILTSSVIPDLLRIFVSKFDFHGLSITGALRLMLNTLAPPNSSSMVAGIIEAVGWEFARQNVNQLPWVRFALDSESESRWRQEHSSASDVEEHANVSTVMLASCMLNTDLHKQAVQRKLSSEQFIASVHGMEACDAIPEQVLISIYSDIQMKPLRSWSNEFKPATNEDTGSGVMEFLHAFRRHIFGSAST